MSAPIEYGKIYHIYNRGNKKESVFLEDVDFEHFLKLYQLLIGSIANTHSWVLMKNHFHFLIQVKDIDEIGYLNPEFATSEDLVKKWTTRQDAHRSVRTHSDPPPAGGCREVRQGDNLSESGKSGSECIPD